MDSAQYLTSAMMSSISSKKIDLFSLWATLMWKQKD